MLNIPKRKVVLLGPLWEEMPFVLFLIKKQASRLLELVEERWGCLGLGAVFVFGAVLSLEFPSGSSVLPEMD